MSDERSRQQHWQTVYRTKSPLEVSWHQDTPGASLGLIESTAVDSGAALLDIGGGASRLVDHLLERGWRDVTVLDISEAALAHARARIGSDSRAHWIAADVTTWSPTRTYALWHDRAVLHFLIGAADQEAYVRALHAALPTGGWAIIGGFAPGGPTRCSGLETVQHDRQSLSAMLGSAFEFVDAMDETHRTPAGGEQAFRFHRFRRIA